MIKTIKRFFWFISVSREYTSDNYFILIFRRNLIIKAIRFCKYMKFDDKMVKKHGALNWYMMMNRYININ